MAKRTPKYVLTTLADTYTLIFIHVSTVVWEIFVQLLLLKFSTGQGTCACISWMEAFERDCCIRGYHVYKEIWQAAIGEELECDKEPDNSCDR